jgi:hypothetical protein
MMLHLNYKMDVTARRKPVQKQLVNAIKQMVGADNAYDMTIDINKVASTDTTVRTVTDLYFE